MHFYFISRGINQQVDLFKKYMETQMFLWKRTNLKTKKVETCQVQGSLRPVQLWEYVFPEECLDEVLTMLQMPDKFGGGLSETKRKILRKALGKGIEPVPKYKKVKTNKFVETRGIAIYPIGIKKDARLKVKEWGYEQEML